MRWEERLLALFDDLEQQAEGLALAERDAEVAEQARAEYARVDLASRFHASLGRALVLAVTGSGQVDATLVRVGDGWCLLEAGRQEWIVRLEAVASVRGLADRAVGQEARPLGARLGLASALRGVADSRAETVLHRLDGTWLRGTWGRVGADFAELLVGDDGGWGPGRTVEVVPFSAVSSVRSV